MMGRGSIKWFLYIPFCVLVTYILFTLNDSKPPPCPSLRQLEAQLRRELAIELADGIKDSSSDVWDIEKDFEDRGEMTGNDNRIQAPKGQKQVKDDVVAPFGLEEVDVEKGKTTPTPPSTTTQPQFEIERHNVDTILDPVLATNNVYYVWCGKRWFEFNNYLSVKSVIREIRPDNIFFYHDFAPILDFWLYNTWFDELRDEFPFFRMVYMSGNNSACSAFAKANLNFIHNLIRKDGGIYVNENTIFTGFPLEFRNLNLVNGLVPETTKGFMMSKVGYPIKGTTDNLQDDETLKTKGVSCTTVTGIIEANADLPLCFHSDTAAKPLFPEDFWEKDDNLGRVVRRIFYGKPDIAKPVPSKDELIPNIAHMVWLGGGEMDFLFYLGVLSLIYVAEMEMVYIHGDGAPTGKYWEDLKRETKLRYIYRESPQYVYGNRVNVISHVTDIWRVDFMIKYGGIYVDTDTVFVRPLDEEIRSYDAVGTYDWTYWNPPFPNTINFGVAIGKKGAPYWHLFQKSMKWFIDKDWSWNGLRQPYKIKERHPELMLVNPYLQVTCFEFKCHPTWWPNYHNESIHHLNTNSIPDWREKIYAYHWTMPTPKELKNENNLYQSDTSFAEIGQYVLKKAGRGRK